MPVEKRKKQEWSGNNEDLRLRLVDEWRGQVSTEPRPYIIEEEDPRSAAVHVYVIWETWADLDQQARSEVITDAFWEFYGPKRGQDLLVAMGLTPVEATRMGISKGQRTSM